MCIMEVRPGQRSATIAQAMAHNLSTIERDLDMFEPLLAARGESADLDNIRQGHEHMKAAYAAFLAVFVHEVDAEVKTGHDGQSDHEHGSERVHVHPNDQDMIAQATADAHRAEKYETR